MSRRVAYSKPKDKNPVNTTSWTAYAESIIKTYSHSKQQYVNIHTFFIVLDRY